MRRRHTDDASPAVLGVLALLRTAGWLYLGLWIAAAATSVGGAGRGLAAAVVAAAGPAILTATLAGLLDRTGRRLAVVPFAAGAVLLTMVAVAAHGAGAPVAVLAAAVLGVVALGAHLCTLGAGFGPGQPVVPSRPRA